MFSYHFFSIITGLLVFTAHFFKEVPAANDVNSVVKPIEKSWFKWPDRKITLSLFSLMLAFVGWKYTISDLDGNVHQFKLDSIENLFESKGSPLAQKGDWSPVFPMADIQYKRSSKLETQELDFFLYGYFGNNSETELVAWENRIFNPKEWTKERSKSLILKVESRDLAVTSLEIVSNLGERRTIFYWYEVPGLVNNDKLVIKAWLAWNVLRGQGKSGVFVAVSTSGKDTVNNVNMLEEWLQENYKHLSAAIAF